MRRPDRFKQYSEITARALNSHAQAIEELQSLLNVNRTKRRNTSPLPVKPNLWVSAPTQGGTVEAPTWEVTVTPGYLTYQQLLNQDDTHGPLFYLTPTINDISIEDTPAQNITLSGTDGRIYMRSATSNRGVPNATPTIDHYATEQISTHHVPESVDDNQSPVDGDYYWLLAEFETVPDSDPARPRIKRRLPGDKHVPNQIDRLKNPDDGVPLYWGFDVAESFHKIRALENADESGSEPLVKALGAIADETVKIKGLIAGTGITLTPSANAITIVADALASGEDLDLYIEERTPIYTDGYVSGFSSDSQTIYYFRAGLYVGTGLPAGGSSLNIASVTHIVDA